LVASSGGGKRAGMMAAWTLHLARESKYQLSPRGWHSVKQVSQNIAHLIVVIVTLMLAVSTAALTQWASVGETPDGRQTAGRETSVVSGDDRQVADNK